MGGQNHQPTSPDITPASAWLSRQIGEAMISVQQANNHLEDAIIVAMKRLHITDQVPSLTGTSAQHLDLSASALRSSLATLEKIDQGFERLSVVAKAIGSRRNPLATSVQKLNLQNLFDGRLLLPRTNPVVWTELLGRIGRGQYPSRHSTGNVLNSGTSLNRRAISSRAQKSGRNCMRPFYTVTAHPLRSGERNIRQV